jgi:hypothetical protein
MNRARTGITTKGFDPGLLIEKHLPRLFKGKVFSYLYTSGQI